MGVNEEGKHARNQRVPPLPSQYTDVFLYSSHALTSHPGATGLRPWLWSSLVTLFCIFLQKYGESECWQQGGFACFELLCSGFRRR